jgi:hypothetical protein
VIPLIWLKKSSLTFPILDLTAAFVLEVLLKAFMKSSVASTSFFPLWREKSIVLISSSVNWLDLLELFVEFGEEEVLEPLVLAFFLSAELRLSSSAFLFLSLSLMVFSCLIGGSWSRPLSFFLACLSFLSFVFELLVFWDFDFCFSFESDEDEGGVLGVSIEEDELNMATEKIVE